MPSLSFKLGGFKTPEFQALDLPVEVRKPNLALVSRTLTSQKIEVSQGTYFVTATLPAGQKLLTQVQVKTSDITAELSPEQDDMPRHESHEQHHFLAEPFRMEKLAGWGPGVDLESFSIENTRSVNVSLLVGSDPLKIADSPYPPYPDFEMLEGGAQYNHYESHVYPQQLQHYLEVVQPDGSATRVALPATETRKCFVVLRASSPKLTSVDVHLQNVEADLLLRGSQTGQQVQIAEQSPSMSPQRLLLEESEEMVRRKMADPIAAAVGAYTLLSWGGLGRLHDWTENLKNWFEWLPDGLAIRGEHLAELGKHEDALKNFVNLSNRGVPMFRDGLSYALERLKLYTETKSKKFAPEVIHQAKDVLGWLQSISLHVDFSQPILTLQGLAPSPQSNSARSLKLPLSFALTENQDAIFRKEQSEGGNVG